MVAAATKSSCSFVFYLKKSQQFLAKKMKLPERWLDYSSFGDKIADIPIICFKTPLSESFSIKNSPYGLKEEDEFRPEHVCEEIKKKGLNLGLVIDLTNTFKYYNGAMEFEQKQGIPYVKLKFNGYDRRCFNDVFRTFSGTVNDFLAESLINTVIGVHCTHGVNRTGYLVCRYMIDVLKYSPEHAIQVFNEARGHCIEKDCFLRDLPLRWIERNKRTSQPSTNVTGSSSRRSSQDDFNRARFGSREKVRNNSYDMPGNFTHSQTDGVVFDRRHRIEYAESSGHQARNHYLNSEYQPRLNEISYYQAYDKRQYNSWHTDRRRANNDRTYPRSRNSNHHYNYHYNRKNDRENGFS